MLDLLEICILVKWKVLNTNLTLASYNFYSKPKFWQISPKTEILDLLESLYMNKFECNKDEYDSSI